MSSRSTPRRRLAQALERAQLTDRQLERAGIISRATLRKFRAGHVRELRIGTVQRLADALGCSAAWLAFGLGAWPVALRQGDVLVARVSLDVCASAEAERWVEELRRVAPGRPVIVLLQGDVETMPEGVARAARSAQEVRSGLGGASGRD